jgi:FixJ family two-component response regulator
MTPAIEVEREQEKRAAAQDAPVVFIVDDDISVRESLQALVRYAGLKAETYASARDFLGRPRATVPNCLVLDIRLPDLGGLELQNHMASERTEMPIIFITGYGDVPMTVQAMKAGAVELLTDRYASLSRREREVMMLVVCGMLNKQVGFELGISEITVKAHRGQVMRKMKALSLADLINMTQKLRLGRASSAVLEEAA